LGSESEAVLRGLLRRSKHEEWAAVAACLLARRGEREALRWFEETFRTLGEHTPMYVARWCSYAVRTRRPWSWMNTSQKKEILRAWLETVSDPSQLRWDESKHQFVPVR
jgi:hypothetical protein